ncbi:MAG: hypothetical protein HYV07_14105 [Deltaproteobacteria bacterium]|nr:hypothetical protein [Deltaproteobacteria bacterium]
MKARGRFNRGRPFVEIGGELFVNLAFDLEPLGDDPRTRVAWIVEARADQLQVLRHLDKEEADLVTASLEQAQVEAWALLCNRTKRAK